MEEMILKNPETNIYELNSINQDVYKIGKMKEGSSKIKTRERKEEVTKIKKNQFISLMEIKKKL